MPTAIEVQEQPVLDDRIWNAWIRKGKREDKVIARKAKVTGGILLLVLVAGAAHYLLPGM